MTLTMFFAFLAAAFLISLSPGAGAVNTLSNGLKYGVRHTVPAILGLQLGYGVQIVVVGVGLGALLASSAVAFTLVKWVGVAYLIWLGCQKWREGAFDLTQMQGNAVPARKRFWQAFWVNLTNPKATVFLLALFPQFLDAQAAHAPQFVIMGITLIVADIVVMLGYAFLATQVLRFLRTPAQQRHLNRLFGGLFITAGIALASVRSG